MTDPQSIAPLNNHDAVLCDFDGTITLEDTGVSTMKAFAPPEWWDVEMAWRRGEIPSTECLTRQFAMADVAPEEYRSFIEGLPVDPGFTGLVSLCRSTGARFVILTDGLDLYIQWILEKLGLTDVELWSNEGRFDGDGRIVCSFPHRHPVCRLHGNCKLAHLFRIRRERRRIIYIGDGYTDMCPSGSADVVFAKDVLAEHCETAGIPAITFDGFSEVIAALSE
jgi:2-hydroxy-3-keto-5-methylthiopentenyl-1-phosphate phosphatase